MKKKVIYRGQLLERPILLGHGKKHGYYWAIVTAGSHPCAYIGIKRGHILYEKNEDELYDDDNITPHGGVTYVNHCLVVKLYEKKDIWWFGWDYGHARDYLDYSAYGIILPYKTLENTKWTYEEIKTEIMILIKKLRDKKL